MLNIAIEWKAFETFGQTATTLGFQMDGTDLPEDDVDICDAIWRQTNEYQGHVWNTIAADLPLDRSHTGVAAGDDVIIDGRRYRCFITGFKPVA